MSTLLVIAATLLAGLGGTTTLGSSTTAPASARADAATAVGRSLARPARPTGPVDAARAAATRSHVPRPRIVQHLIPFGARRRAETRAYAERHYGLNTSALRNPRVIVEHWTETTTASSAWNTFADDVPDVELHELPQTCAHYLIDRDGTIEQLVSTTLICRHTVGLNWTAIGIEHVGMSDDDVMDDQAERHASIELTRYLRCRYDIPVKNVIGHNESLSSPYHHERVAALRAQTHDDMTRATMTRYRALLARHGCS